METEDPFIQAGKYSLRVLEGEELVQAQRAILTDPSFMQAVEWWDRRLGTMAEEATQFAPSSATREAILNRIKHESAADRRVVTIQPKTERPSRWSVGFAMFGTAMAAAALVLYVSTPATNPPVGPTTFEGAQPQLIAQLQNEDGTSRLASLINPTSQRLSVRVSGLEAGEGQVAELWVIPEGGVPQSLGYIPNSGVLERNLTGAESELLLPGSSLAVTFEEDTGAPHEAPSPPILLIGAIDSI